MLEHESRSAQPTELIAIIAQVRRRWRLKLALRGTVRVVIVAMLLVLTATYGIEWARSSGLSILVSRVGFALVLWPRPSGSWCGRFVAASPTTRWRSISRNTSRRS